MIRKPTNQLLIKPKVSNNMRLLTIGAIVVASLAALYGAFQLGVRSGNEHISRDQQMISQLSENLEDLRSKLAESEESLVIAQRQRQIQEEAYKQINIAYASSEKKNKYLGSRLDFYRSIISPESGKAGPAIQAINVKSAADKLGFDVTLVQAIKHKHQVQALLFVEIYDQNNKLIEQWPNKVGRAVNFQYFQQVSGVFAVAKLPANAKIRVLLNLQNDEPIERWFNSNELIIENN